MPKIMIHSTEARQALARGVKRLAAAVEPTLGPKGMNAMIDRPIGTPMVTRDGVSHRQPRSSCSTGSRTWARRWCARSRCRPTRSPATAPPPRSCSPTRMVQGGVEATDARRQGRRSLPRHRPRRRAPCVGARSRRRPSRPRANGSWPRSPTSPRPTASSARWSPRPIARVGAEGVITTDFGVDHRDHARRGRGHVLRPRLSLAPHGDRPGEDGGGARTALHPDDRPQDHGRRSSSTRVRAHRRGGRPAAADRRRGDVRPKWWSRCSASEGPGKYLVVHPPEYGHWRKAMMEDLAILTGGRVIARDLGGRLEDITREDLGAAERGADQRRRTPRSSAATATPDAIAARRAQVQRQYDARAAQHRAGQAARAAGQALRRHGGALRRRRHAGRAEAHDPADRGLAQRGPRRGRGRRGRRRRHRRWRRSARCSTRLIADVDGDVAEGVRLVQSVLSRPLARIALNAGARSRTSRAPRSARVNGGHGYNADDRPVRRTCSQAGDHRSGARDLQPRWRTPPRSRR